MDVKSQLSELIKNKKRFTLATEAYFYLDCITADISDDETFSFLCNFVTTAYSKEVPTFGTSDTNTGLQEIIMPYDKVYCIEVFDASSTILEKFKTENPKAYEYWKNANHVEGVIIK